MIIEAASPAPTGWRLDRSITLPLIVSLGIASFTGGGIALQANTAWNSTTNRVEQLEAADRRLLDRSDERYAVVKLRLEALERDRASDTVRLTRLEEQFRWVQDAFGRIERKLDGARR